MSLFSHRLASPPKAATALIEKQRLSEQTSAASAALTVPEQLPSEPIATLPAPRSSLPAPRPPTSDLRPLTSSPSTAPCFVQPTDSEIALARQKSAFVYAVKERSGRDSIPLRTACDLVAARPQDFPLLLKAGKHGLSALAGSRAWSNFRSWSKAAGKDGANWRKLLPGYRGSREYVRPGPDEFWTRLAEIYETQNKVSLKVSYYISCRHLSSKYDLPELPTYDEAKHYYSKHVDKKRVIIAREGEEFYRNNYAGYIDRDAPDVDECWIGDHHKFDVAVRVWSADKGKWIPVRPWLTAWLDWGSNFLVGGIVRAEDPNRDPIERALREAIACNAMHPPARLYIDNGKDYKALGFARRADWDEALGRVDTVAAHLGCRVHFAIPYNARAKVVERWFKEVCENFSKGFESYIGNKPENRPENFMQLWNNPESLPTLDQFRAVFFQWIATIAHHKAGDGKALKGRTPFEARKNFRYARPALSEEELQLAFLRDLGTRQISRGGVVEVAGGRYRHENLYALMGNVKEVRVKLDPDDVSKAWCFLPDGRGIAVAEKVKSLSAFHDGDPQKIEDLRAQQKLNAGQQAATRRDSKQAKGHRAFSTLPSAFAGLTIDATAQPAALPQSVSARQKALPSYSNAEDVAAMEAALAAHAAGTDYHSSPTDDAASYERGE